MINVSKLSFAYSDNDIITNVDAVFRKGEICSIIGRNGSGKTTFLKLLARLEAPKFGSVFIDELPLSSYNRKAFAKKVAYLPQIMNSPSITVGELAAHGRFPYLGFSRSLNKVDKDIIDNALILTDAVSLKNKNLKELSGGERRRAYLAMIFAQDAEYILLDEPAAYLDISYKFEIMEILNKMKSTKALIIVMHDIDIALKYSDKILVLNNGENAFFGTPDELLETDIINKVFGIECLKIQTDNGFEYICSKNS